ncbi:kinase-like domain-containing protein [Immersiella caudata]|uniref:mitogen-activated protein kinase n=1 Tax=Immersiella caudata TaxID=314043 RepID=A0AA39X4J8_9PEZI|nr:kinase-like domain-containing protein [Immersiella caudata]
MPSLPSRQRNRHAIFTLYPQSPSAHVVVEDTANARLVSYNTQIERYGIDVGISGASSHQTLETLGRATDAGIHIPIGAISRLQCSFEIHDESKAIMLYDRSSEGSTEVFAWNQGKVCPFDDHRPRRVLVAPQLNELISMGHGDDPVKFRLIWWKKDARGRRSSYLVPNPNLARTYDIAETEKSSRPRTRIHTGMNKLIRYFENGQIGTGKFGAVHSAIDVDTGKPMAVKVISRPKHATGHDGDAFFLAVKTEVETLKRLVHENIVGYIGCNQGIEEYKIFMDLCAGSLRSLATSPDPLPTAITDVLLEHMLRALAYLDSQSMVHRDVKPDNILYRRIERHRGQHSYHFELGDLGLCDSTVHIQPGVAGTTVYMAPEVARQGQPTPKSDVWSLFMTELWALDVKGFRKLEHTLDNLDAIFNLVFASLEDSRVACLKEMAEADPDRRASAAQMLEKLFGSDGSSTPCSLAQSSTQMMSMSVPATRRPRSRQRRQRHPRLAPAPGTSKSPLPMARRGTFSRWDREGSSTNGGTM